MLRYAVTIFLSAFLLFQVQPLISKYILPWFGGIPSVWTTCLLFFQVVLLGGYAYAHAVATRLPQRRQVVLHLALLGVALVILALAMPPSSRWKPEGHEDPVWRILLLLGASVGLPYFILSTTGPLLQAWFSRTSPGRSPYRLYSLSNVGSLLALISFPFVVEPWLSSTAQSVIWSAGFALFALSCAYVALKTWNLAAPALAAAGPAPGELATANAADPAPAEPAAPAPAAPADESPSLGVRLLWLALPMCASMLLLGTTSKICQDVAVVPFLWILPLSLYLLTFIICFDNERWYFRPVFWPLFFGATVLIVWLMFRGVNSTVHGLVNDVGLMRTVKDAHGVTKSVPLFPWVEPLSKLSASIQIQVIGYAVGLFVCCMVCHGELVRLKPSPRHLTSFYLMISLGGALGGIFVGMVAPHIFPAYWEFNIALWGAMLFGTATMCYRLWRWLLRRTRPVEERPLHWAVWLALSSLVAGLWYLGISELAKRAKCDTLLTWLVPSRDAGWLTWAVWGALWLSVMGFWLGLWAFINRRQARSAGDHPAHAPSRWLSIAAYSVVVTLLLTVVIRFQADNASFLQVQGSWWVYTCVCAILVAALARFMYPHVSRWPTAWVRPALVASLFIVVVLGEELRQEAERASADALSITRNFYGVLRVTEYGKSRPSYHHYTLTNGRISHGWQLASEEGRRKPISYFAPESGVGLTFENYPRNGKGIRVGVLGLGVGTFAAYGKGPDPVTKKGGDNFTFYEINPECDKIAGLWKDDEPEPQEETADADEAKPERKPPPKPPKPPRFTYLRDLKARDGKVDVRIGDGRLTLERELKEGKPQGFDILALDAFSSDAVPVHLLTKEAFDIYLPHMKAGGVILVNITNRYIDLCPVIDKMVEDLNRRKAEEGVRPPDAAAKASEEFRPWRSVLVEYNGDSSDDLLSCAYWIIVTRNGQLLDCEAIRAAAESGTRRGPHGISTNDVLLTVNDRRVKDIAQLSRVVAAAKADTPISFTILRAGKEYVLSVTPAERQLKGPEAEEDAAMREITRKLGMAVQELTPELAAKLDCKPDKGLVVAEVEEGGPAAKAEPVPLTVRLWTDDYSNLFQILRK